MLPTKHEGILVANTSSVRIECDLSDRNQVSIQRVVHSKTARVVAFLRKKPIRGELFYAIDAQTGKKQACIRLLGCGFAGTEDMIQ